MSERSDLNNSNDSRKGNVTILYILSSKEDLITLCFFLR